MRVSVSGVLWAAILLASAAARENPYPHRWFFVARGLSDDRQVEEIRALCQTASTHGLNGMVLSAGLDKLDRPDLLPAGFTERLLRVKSVCDEYGIELIPQLFSVGYGGSVLAHNRNLAEGLSVRNALFTVTGGEARLTPDPAAGIVNGGFEDYAGNRVSGFRFHDQPGEISFVDTSVFHGGAASLRFENFTANQYGHGRVMQEVAVTPRRCYRLSLWVKTENLAPAGVFRVQVLSMDGRALAPVDPAVPATSGWRQVIIGFNSMNCDKVRLYAGVWGATGGRFWIDDWQLEEVGLVNLLRRPGTPVLVRGEDKGVFYEEGLDYAPLADAKLNFRFDHDGPAIRLLPETRIEEGERLRVDYYHGVSMNNGQVTICMSEPETYDIWRAAAARIQELLQPRTFLLSMDEIRAGGSCQACQGRQMSMGQILGDCFTRQFNLLREMNPEAEVYTWSDMLDPNHNAHGNYYLVEGDFTGSWENVPKELGIVCWYYAKRRESLDHFSGLGFRTVAGAYYDGDTLENPRGWLEALDATSNACGIMYTTWQNKYGLLAAFGDLVSLTP